MISIRAPAKGATLSLMWMHIRQNDFNPRSREGSDSVFQVKWNKKIYFNPRSREGSDFSILSPFCHLSQFQSALPRRERLFFKYVIFSPYNISIRAPAKGATKCAPSKRFFNVISIRAPAKGATIPAPPRQNTKQISIRAPAKGATAILYNNFHFFV